MLPRFELSAVTESRSTVGLPSRLASWMHTAGAEQLVRGVHDHPPTCKVRRITGSATQIHERSGKDRDCGNETVYQRNHC